MKTLVVLTGPTGVGKTRLSLKLAHELGSPVISCDSRQMYREMKIGTAAPTAAELAQATHYFVGHLSIHDYYNAARYEEDVIQLLDRLFRDHDRLLLTGGSMLYLDAVCRGIDEMPDVDPALRETLRQRLAVEGLDSLLGELRWLDPVYYAQVDRRNPQRVVHGLEMCLTTGRPFSSLRGNTPKQRPFKIVKICLHREREELYRRIDRRVEQMVADGLEDEARSLWAFRHLNALQTVGYREWFDCFDGKCTREEAIRQIAFNTHKYARKQITWFRRDPEYSWADPDNWPKINAILSE